MGDEKTGSELNTELYQKMFAEQEQYKAKLLTMTPQEILEQAYEFVIREDILLSLEYSDLSAKQAKALLQTDTPLADIFTKWEKRETDHMTDIWDTVESRANELLRQSFLAAQREGRCSLSFSNFSRHLVFSRAVTHFVSGSPLSS